MKTVICFGDSNTYGYDPRSCLGGRYGRYRRLAERLGVRFADAGAWGVALAYDGVHFTSQGHRAFAAGLCGALGL